jgi:aspartyl-tRNA(Asn)/glutamyl-tRNA(Gln) amidotransferase subunit C
VADLARLRVPEDRLESAARQIDAILRYVAKIGEVDVTGVEPLSHPIPLANVLREDEPGPALTIEQVLTNAPETDGRFFKVPKVLGMGEDSAG